MESEDKCRSDVRVNYDRIASTYDRRYVANRLSGVAEALLSLARRLRAERTLEVGCGTGRWLAELRCATSHLYGLDLSTGMLQEARKRRAQFSLVRGRASRLPFPDAVFDLVYCVNALHHFDHPGDFVFEARRLLRPGGVVAVVGMGPHSGRDQWYVYHYFEGTYEADIARFPSWGTVLDWMVAGGFERIEWQVVESIRDSKVGWKVFKDPFLQKDSTSQLVLLSDDAYAAGLRRIEAALREAEATGETLVFPADLTLGMLVGRVQGDKRNAATSTPERCHQP